MSGSFSALLSDYINTLDNCLNYEKDVFPEDDQNIVTNILGACTDSDQLQLRSWFEATHKAAQICMTHGEWDALEEIIESAEKIHLSLVKKERHGTKAPYHSAQTN